METRHSVVQGTWEYSAPRLVKEKVLSAGMQVTLRREPSNQYDHNAASVYVGQSKLGYLARNLAAEVAPYLDAGGKYSGVITNVGQRTHKGSKYPSVSVDFTFHNLRAPSGVDSLLQAATGFVGVRGVYMVFNTIENRGYIGSSSDVGQRFKQHINHLHNGQHPNHKMSLAWRAHGPQSFQLTLVEHVGGSDLLDREKYHVQRLGTHTNGYNHSADGMGHIPKTAEHIAEITNRSVYGSPSGAMSKLQAPIYIQAPQPQAQVRVPASHSGGSGCCIIIFAALAWSSIAICTLARSNIELGEKHVSKTPTIAHVTLVQDAVRSVGIRH